MINLASQHKQREIESLLARGVVMVHLDPRVEGVVVPPQFSQQPALRLNVAYAFNLPALDVNEEGVYAVLSFNRQNFGCTIPWRAVFALTLPYDDHDGMVWPDSMPVELRESHEAGEAGEAAAGTAAVPTGGVRPAFAVHEGGGGDSSSDNTKPKRGHLTLIKS
jgi:hypothetical protein